MSLSIPVNFTQLTAKNQSSSGYPAQIKASDLQKNFIYCALDTADGLVEPYSGPGGYPARRLKILPGDFPNQILIWNGAGYVPFSPPPEPGTWVLGAVNGIIDWLSTEKC